MPSATLPTDWIEYYDNNTGFYAFKNVKTFQYVNKIEDISKIHAYNDKKLKNIHHMLNMVVIR